MSKEIAIKQDKNKVDHELSIVEQVVMQGDLSKLNPEQRVIYYRKVCDSCGLNPFTRPFDYITLNGKLTLYAKKDATEQLRKINGISIVKMETSLVDDLYIVKATARTQDGREDQATGAVTIGNLKGDAKANAIMKAETKAKRRVTLSISGMGWTDETEIESIPGAAKVEVDLDTGEIKNASSLQIELSDEEIQTFYNNFNGDKAATEAYVKHCVDTKRKKEPNGNWTPSKMIQSMQQDLEAAHKFYKTWSAKQAKVEEPETIVITGE